MRTPLPLSPAALQGDLGQALAEVEGVEGDWAAWREGWALAAMGRYGGALTALDSCNEPLPSAAAAVTRASILRQVALHAEASVADAAARAALDHAPSGPQRAELAAAVAIGEVADAVGLGDDDRLAGRLEAATAAVAATTSWRQRLRLGWVTGEVAMVERRWNQAADAFTAAAGLAGEAGAVRHHAKSMVFVAAASSSAGDRANAGLLAAEALRSATIVGADPIRWPAALVLAGVRAAEDQTEEATGLLDEATTILGRLLDSLPEQYRPAAARRSALLSGLSP